MRALPFLFVFLVLASAGFAADAKFPKTMEAYERLRAALAGDQLSGAKSAASGVVRAAHEEQAAQSKVIADSAQALAASATLVEARRAFRKVSEAFIEQTKGAPGLVVFTCPMAENAPWAQTTRTPANPYQGKAMLECAKIVTK